MHYNCLGDFKPRPDSGQLFVWLHVSRPYCDQAILEFVVGELIFAFEGCELGDWASKLPYSKNKLGIRKNINNFTRECECGKK